MGIGFWELMLVGVIALIVIHPKDLPKIAHALGVKIRQCQQALHAIQNNIKFPPEKTDDNRSDSTSD